MNNEIVNFKAKLEKFPEYRENELFPTEIINCIVFTIEGKNGKYYVSSVIPKSYNFTDEQWEEIILLINPSLHRLLNSYIRKE